MSSLEDVSAGVYTCFTSYAQLTPYLTEICQHFKLPITDKEAREWEIMLTAAPLTDYYLDQIQDPNERSIYADNVCCLLEKGVNNFTDPNLANLTCALLALHEVLTKLPPDRIQSLTILARNYFKLTEQIKTTTSAVTYARATWEEGVNTAFILVSLLPDSILESSRYQQFFALLKHTNITANLWDNIIDLCRDLAQGLARVKPRVWTYGCLLMYSLPSAIYSFTHIPLRIYFKSWHILKLGLTVDRNKN